MTTYILAPDAVQRFVDANGVALTGGKLFTYTAGSTTKLATYQDSAGTPNVNPILLNSRGEANIWLPAGTPYKFVLAPSTDSDPPTNAIWTVDNVVANSGVLVDASDTTAGTLSQKIVAGTGLATSVVNAGGNEQLQIGFSGGSPGLTGVTNSTLLVTGTTVALSLGLLRGYIAGLTLSNDAGAPTTTIDISAGTTISDAQDFFFTPSAFTKTTGAWVVGSGNGGLDTGAIASNTWYHVYVIGRSDTNNVDYLFSTSASAPTMPTNYGSKRRIGAFRTVAANAITAFTQLGDDFLFSDTIVSSTGTSVAVTNAGVTTSNGINVPLGIKAIVRLRASFHTDSSGTQAFLNIQSPDETISAVSPASLANYTPSQPEAMGTFFVRTNASQQIKVCTGAQAGHVTFITVGWTDYRGKYD